MCPGKDLNLHALRRLLLRQVRLPISPPGRIFTFSHYYLTHNLSCHRAFLCTDTVKLLGDYSVNIIFLRILINLIQKNNLNIFHNSNLLGGFIIFITSCFHSSSTSIYNSSSLLSGSSI